MAHNHVRIVRKGKTDAQMMLAWSGCLTVFLRIFLGWYYRPQVQANLDIVQDAKLEEIRMRTRVQAMREIKLSNEIVIQEMKLEELKKGLQGRNILPPDKNPNGDAY